MRALLLIGLILLTSMTHAAGFDHQLWDELLNKNVVSLRQGQASQVDYGAMQADRPKLLAYLKAAGAVPRASFDAWPKQEQLAFLINVYNAATVDMILSAYPKLKSIKDLGSLLQSPWKKRIVTLFGELYSLDNVEHDLIRGSGRYNEPRVHFAANCASIGCPALRTEAFVAERLDAQLEESTKAFLSDRSRNRLNGTTLQVSSIFKWYQKDFEKGWRGSQSLAQFFTLYASALGLNAATRQNLTAGKIDIEFLDYDWHLNRTPERP